MKKQKTSVQFFLEALLDNGYLKHDENDFIKINKLLSEVFEMERKQIIDAWDNGFANGDGKFDDEPQFKDGNTYYYETINFEL